MQAEKLKNGKPEAFTKVNQLWQRLTGVLAPVILTLLVIWKATQPTTAWFEWLLWLHLPLLIFHEFEEYVLPGGFKHFFNYYTALSLDPPSDNYPIDETKTFFINIGFWIWIILGALLASTAPWVGVSAVIFQIMNGFAHTVLLQAQRPGYNPGIITTVFILIPYIVVTLSVSITQVILGPVDWIISFVIGFGAMVIMIWFSNFYNRPN